MKKRLDLNKSSSFYGILRFRKLFRELEVGDELEILTYDQEMTDDIARIVEASGEGAVQRHGEKGSITVIKKITV